MEYKWEFARNVCYTFCGVPPCRVYLAGAARRDGGAGTRVGGGAGGRSGARPAGTDTTNIASDHISHTARAHRGHWPPSVVFKNNL